MDRKSISIGCGIWGPILSAVIIASRAVCGSVPLEEWSFLLWILMSLPVTFPAMLVFGIFAGAALVYAFAWAALRISDRRIFRRDR
jgi:hypothetical protein